MKCKKCNKETDKLDMGLCDKCFKQTYDIMKRELAKESDQNIVNNEIEEIVAAGLLNDRFILNKAIQHGFETKIFQSGVVKDIVETILDINSERPDMIDINLVKTRLASAGKSDAAVLVDRLRSLSDVKFSQVKLYLDILKEKHSEEIIRDLGLKLISFVENKDDKKKKNIVDFIGQSIKDLGSLQKQQMKKGVTRVKSELLNIAHEIQKRNTRGELLTIGYDIRPFNDLNQSLSGLRKGFLYGIGGAPRRGKTTFTLEIATNLAIRNNIPVIFVTWEQTKKNLVYRLLAKETQINPDTLQRKQISKYPDLEVKFAKGWRKMEGYMERLFIIEGSKEDTLERVKTYAYNAMQEFNTDEIVLFFDYLQKMPMSGQYLDEKFKVEEISTQMKLLSLELNCPIIVISSLNKEGCNVDQANSKDRPGIYHCKGSGDIEYDLDVAMIMAKDWEDSRELGVQMKNLAQSLGKNVERLPKVDIIDVYLDKNRDAPEGISSIIQYLFIIEANKFVEIGYKVESDNYRFRKIENIIKKLFEEGYVQFRDMEGNVSNEKPDVSF